MLLSVPTLTALWAGIATSSWALKSLGISSEGEHFIAHKVKANADGLRPVKIERLDSLFDVGPQLVPRVALCEDALGQALGAIPAVRFLSYVEHNFVHLTIRPREGMRTWYQCSAPS